MTSNSPGPKTAPFTQRHRDDLTRFFADDGPAIGLAGCGFELGAPATEPVWERTTTAMLRRVGYLGFGESEIAKLGRTHAVLVTLPADTVAVLRARYRPGRWHEGMLAGDDNAAPLTRIEHATEALYGVVRLLCPDLGHALAALEHAEGARRAAMANPEAEAAEGRYAVAIARRAGLEAQAEAVVARLALALVPYRRRDEENEYQAARAELGRVHALPWPQREPIPETPGRPIDRATNARTKAAVDEARGVWKAAVKEALSRAGVAVRNAEAVFAGACPRGTKRQRIEAELWGEPAPAPVPKVKVKAERAEVVSMSQRVADLIWMHGQAVGT
jgi:hypothetical protein